MLKDIVFDGHSVYSKFYNKNSAINHEFLPNNNSNETCIINDVNDTEIGITHNEITTLPNSNSNGITDANIIAVNEENEISSISKFITLNDLTENVNCFSKEYRNLMVILRKESKNLLSKHFMFSKTC